MVLRGILLSVVLASTCAHDPPTPTPAPVDPTCGMQQAAYDELSDDVVLALGDDLSWETRLNVAGPEATIRCVLSNVVVDLRGARVEVSRASDWLAKHK